MSPEEYEARLVELQARGMRGTFARVFAEYVAERSEPDRAFDALYVEGLFVTGTAPYPLRRRDRFRRLLQEFARTLTLTGNVAECGCFRGLSSFLLCSRLHRHDRAFNGAGYEIYDSFEGLSEPQAEDSQSGDEMAARSLQAGRFGFPIEEVRRALGRFPRISYGPGWIPSAFPEDDRRYRFVHVDVDLYQPTRASLAHFWPRLVPGGIIVCDDFNWSGARRAVEELGAEFVVTPNNQAVFTKP